MAIRSLLQSGVKAENICLTMRNIADYDQFIRTVFHRLSIPFSMRRGIPMLQSPLVKTITRCLSCGGKKIRFDGLLSLVDSAFIKLPQQAELRSLVCRSGIFETHFQSWPDIVEKQLRRAGSETDYSDASFKAFSSFVEQVEALAGEKATFATVTGFIKNWFQLPEKNFHQHQHHLQQFMKLLQETAEADKYQRNDLGLEPEEKPLRILVDAITDGNIQLDSSHGSGVKIATFFDAGYLDFDHALFIGMDENSVPKSGGAPGALTDRLRETINKETTGNVSLQLQSEKWLGEAQAFLLAVSAARQSIRFYYTRNDSNGHEVISSPYYSEMQSLAGVPDSMRLPGGDQRSMEYVPADSYSAERQVLRRLLQKNTADDKLARAVHMVMLEDGALSARLSQVTEKVGIEQKRFEYLISSYGPKPAQADIYSGAIKDPALLAGIEAELGADDYQWSVSTVESAIRSSFTFFLKKLLHAKELTLPTREPDSRTLGNFAHLVLEKTVDLAKEAYPSPGLARLQSTLQEITPASLQEMFKVDSFDSLALPLRLSLRQIMLQINDFLLVEAENTAIPLELEKSFSGNETVLQHESEKMVFRGRFDRTNRLEDTSEELEIVDYKLSGDAGLKTSQISLEKGKRLQMPMYMILASVLYNLDLKKIIGTYVSLRKPEGATGLSLNINDIAAKSKPKPQDLLLLALFDEENEEAGLIPAMFRKRQELISGCYPPTGSFYDSERLVSRYFELSPEMTGGDSNG